MKLAKQLKTLAFGTALTCFATVGFAASHTWTLSCVEVGNDNCLNDTGTGSSGSTNIDATVTAYRVSSSNANDTYSQTDLQQFSGGLGAGGESPNEHAFDNVGFQEFAFIEFDQSIALEYIYLGWTGGDEDVSVLAYTGDDAFNINTKLAGLKDTQLVGAGWEIISSFDAGGTGWSSVNNGTNGSGVSSSYWLVGAYNNVFSPLVNNSGGGSDYFKLKKLHGTKTHTPPPPGVPAPGTAALLALGLLLMRRKAA